MSRLRLIAEQYLEECRVPVGRPDFKSGRGCKQSLVGSTPILFRQETTRSVVLGVAGYAGRKIKNEGPAQPLVPLGQIGVA